MVGRVQTQSTCRHVLSSVNGFDLSWEIGLYLKEPAAASPFGPNHCCSFIKILLKHGAAKRCQKWIARVQDQALIWRKARKPEVAD